MSGNSGKVSVSSRSLALTSRLHALHVIFSTFLPERDYVTFGSLLSQFRLSSVCLSSVTLVHPTQGAEAFGNISSSLVRWPSSDIRAKFYGDRPRGTPPPGAYVKRKRGIKIDRFWTYRRYIS